MNHFVASCFKWVFLPTIWCSDWH